MSVAQSGFDLGGDLVQSQSDDATLCVGRCGFYDLWHYAVLLDVKVFIHREFHEIAACTRGRMGRCRVSNRSSAVEEPVGPVDLDQCAHIRSELLPSHE